MEPGSSDRGGRALAIRRALTGRPLAAWEASKAQINPVEGLSALSLDALTSVAYGPEAILVVLATAGVAALHLIVPITVGIVVLLAILVVSYRQVINAYPGGGGSYAVSRDNFGPGVSQLSASALIVDYTLTVAVSITAGVGSLTAAFPGLSSATVPMGLGILALITLLNLRGLGEGARAFLLPTMVFIVGLLAFIAIGLIHPLGLNTPVPGQPTAATHSLESVGILLVLKAFASGCSALTGVEAIANGVPLFKEPRVKRAKRTELMLGVILGVMLLGLAVLANRFHVQPRTSGTVLSQIMIASIGHNWAYYVISITVTIVLALAANTSFGGLPLLSSLLARDNYLPHLFSLRDDRLTYGNGIWALAVMAGALIVASGGNTNALIPLFAIGVFIGFTLAQAGLVVHWRRLRPSGWRRRAAINGFGALVTGVATIVFLGTKFLEGAWVVVIAIPAFILLFHRIEAYYRRAAIVLGYNTIPPKPTGRRTTVVVPVQGVSGLAGYALSEAMSLGQEVIAVHVVFEGDGTESSTDAVAEAWRRWDPGVRLELLPTSYSSVVEPIVRYIDQLQEDRTDQLVVLIPTVSPTRVRYRILHNQLDLTLSRALKRRPDVVVARITLPMSQMEESGC